ncbi:peroxynitrite isomerase THAP4-like [Paramacrobiotus metropolitanus]|uniref:peroxynitrite isomerase THAP4-like n=1 Tax=Paramacrobiotus metropolitanus TaxID=2943436 RepID=UPI00244646ED|nr:peroxynitrite isomerase THAP4-like [Paramacrobiotus metropolitanus]
MSQSQSTFAEPSTPMSVHKSEPQAIGGSPHKNYPCQPRFLPDQLECLAWLAGKWNVFEPGKCHYPTIKDFAYAEKIEFVFGGQPMLDYKAESWDPSSQPHKLLHREQGFLRIKPGTNQIAFVLAHNFGVSETLEGTCMKNQLVVETTGISRMSFAAEPAVVRTRRTYKYDPEKEELEHIMEMETKKTPLTEHLRIKYKRATHTSSDDALKH